MAYLTYGARRTGLSGAADADVFAFAVAQARIVVTENVVDFAVLVQRSLSRDEPSVPVLLVRRADLPSGVGSVESVARRLDE